MPLLVLPHRHQIPSGFAMRVIYALVLSEKSHAWYQINSAAGDTLCPTSSVLSGSAAMQVGCKMSNGRGVLLRCVYCDGDSTSEGKLCPCLTRRPQTEPQLHLFFYCLLLLLCLVQTDLTSLRKKWPDVT